MPLHLALPTTRISPQTEFLPTDRFAIELDRLQRIRITAEGAERLLQREQRHPQAVTVIAGTTDQQIASTATLQFVIALTTMEAVVTSTAIELVITTATQHQVVATAGEEGVVLTVAEQHIVEA